METNRMLRVESLSKTIDHEEVLNMTFSFEKKGVHGILAPRGAGKTMLLNILAGWDSSFDGAIYLKDVSVEKDALIRKRQVGYVPAQSALDPTMTVLETMEFLGKAKHVPAEKLESQIREALSLVGLLDQFRRLVANLSEGQRKLLSIAAALLGNPKILLLDEPTRRISIEERESMMSLLRALGAVKTVILATEDFSEAQALCHDIVLMADGKVIAAGTFEELNDRLEGTTLRAAYDILCGKEEQK